MFIVFLSLLFQPAADPYAKWEKEIVGIEKKLKESPPAPGGVTFVGSSTIRRWDLKKSFPGEPYVNAGFGGSVTADATHFLSRIVVPQKPAAIVFYSGDNDIALGRTAEQVREDTHEFVSKVHKELPKTKIVIIGIKPSVARVKQFEIQKKANELVKRDREKDPLVKFIDPAPLILGSDGKPNPALFATDGLHLNEAGYEPIAKEVAKLLAK